MNPFVKTYGAALATGAAALTVVVMGITSASAGEGLLSSIATAPALTCANGVGTPDLKVFGATEYAGADAVAIVNNYVARTAGWVNQNANPAYTQARSISKSASEVDVRDNALRRIGVYVVNVDTDGNHMSRAFTCANPVVTVAPGFAVNSKAAK